MLFDSKQRLAVETAVNRGLLILTGGPGTGKTTTVKGISRPKAREIQRSFAEKFSSRRTIGALIDKGLTQEEAFRAYQFFHENAEEVFEENPYNFVSAGILGFERCDEINDALGCPAQPMMRAESLIEHILRHNIDNGHTCLPRSAVVKTACGYLECGEDTAQTAVDNDIEQNRVFSEEMDGRDFLFLPDAYNAEKDIADRRLIVTDILHSTPP